jgi:hypothetical protein
MSLKIIWGNFKHSSQAVSRQFCIAEARVRSWVSPRGSRGGQSRNGAGLSPSASVFPCQCHSTNSPHSSSSLYHSYQRFKGAEPGNLPTQCCFFGEKQLSHEVLNNVQSPAVRQRGNICGLVTHIYFVLGTFSCSVSFGYAVEGDKSVNELGNTWNVQEWLRTSMKFVS